MTPKDKQRELLIIACEKKMAEDGSLKTHGLDYCPYIRQQINNCDRVGWTRVEIQAVLSKYTNELVIQLPNLKRRKND